MEHKFANSVSIRFHDFVDADLLIQHIGHSSTHLLDKDLVQMRIEESRKLVNQVFLDGLTADQQKGAIDLMSHVWSMEMDPAYSSCHGRANDRSGLYVPRSFFTNSYSTYDDLGTSKVFDDVKPSRVPVWIPQVHWSELDKRIPEQDRRACWPDIAGLKNSCLASKRICLEKGIVSDNTISNSIILLL